MTSPSRNHNRRNRRHIPRRSTRVICFKGPLGLGANLARGIRDLSEEGVCLILTEELPIGQEVEINLESIQHRRPIRIPGRIVWVRQGDDNTMLAGVHFDKLLAYRDLQALAQIG